MFNQLEGMQFSEVNRAVVTIEQLHLQPVAVHSEGALPAGTAVPQHLHAAHRGALCFT